MSNQSVYLSSLLGLLRLLCSTELLVSILLLLALLATSVIVLLHTELKENMLAMWFAHRYLKMLLDPSQSTVSSGDSDR